MKKNCLSLFFLISFCYRIAVSASAAGISPVIPPIHGEKIYLVLDRETVQPGDTFSVSGLVAEDRRFAG